MSEVLASRRIPGTMWLRPAYPCVVALLVSACSASDGAVVPPADVSVPEAAADAAGPPVPSSCEDEPLALHATEAEGHLTRLFLETTHEGRRVALLFDTGSATTFLERPRGTPDPARRVADLAIGTCSVLVDGRPYPTDETIAGLDVVGTLGADILLGGAVSELDLGAKTIVRRVATPLSSEILAWPTARLDVVRGHLLVHVTVDGAPLRLMLDTGAPHILWAGRAANAGDEKVRTTDAAGNALALYLGTADLALADGLSSRVPILRAPTFPYFEETVRVLGGDIHGLLGLSALGRRRIVVDRDAGVLRIGP